MKFISTFTITIIVAILFTACKTKPSNENLTIVSVSIGPQKYFIEQLMPDKIDVNVMIPPGSNHATYAPTVAQLQKLSSSKAYFLMGHISFESAWTERIKEANPQMKWFDLSDGIEVIHGEHHHHHHHHDHDHVCSGGVDPHTWTSPKQAIIIATNLKQALLTLLPEEEALINKRYDTLISNINKLEQRLEKLKLVKPNLSFMIFHPAYTYLAKDYGFEQITIEFEGKTPTPARMQKTIESARNKAVSTIYIQQEFDQSNAEVIAKEINAKTIQVNPLSEEWFLEMKKFIGHLENS